MISQKFPKTLIVILNWNNAPDTIKCLDSLKQIDYPDYEILLIDNASTDDSVKEIHKFFPEIEIVINKKNIGVSGGRNVGIDIALARMNDNSSDTPHYILFLDNDLIVEKTFLKEMVSVAVSNPGIGVLGCKIFFLDKPDTIWATGGILNFSKGTTVLRGMYELDQGQYDNICEVDYAVGCTFLVTKEALKIVGHFDTIFGIYCAEEIDWCIRARQKGFKVMYIPSAKVWHKISQTIPGTNYWFQKARNHLILMHRYASFGQWVSFLITSPLVLFNAARYQIQHGNIKNLYHIIRGSIASRRASSR